jgi:hypothetical protein
MNKKMSKSNKKLSKNQPNKYEEQEKYLNKLHELYDREKQTRCYFQLERDKLNKLREVEKIRNEELNAKLVALNEKLAHLEHLHNKEMTNMAQKVQYLIGEREMKLNKLKIELNDKSSETFKVSVDTTSDFWNTLRDHISLLNENASNFDKLIKNITIDYENKISKINLDSSESIRIVQNISASKFKNEREHFSLITRNAINEITELKNAQIESMNNIKNKCFDDLRDYFQSLTKDLIDTVDKLKEKNERIEKNLKEKLSKLNLCTKELTELKTENDRIKSELKFSITTVSIYKSEKKLFQSKSAQFKSLTDKYNELDLKYEEMLTGYEALKRERDKLLNYITNLVRIFQEKLNNIHFISNKKTDILQNELNKYLELFNEFKLN